MLDKRVMLGTKGCHIMWWHHQRAESWNLNSSDAAGTFLKFLLNWSEQYPRSLATMTLTKSVCLIWKPPAYPLNIEQYLSRPWVQSTWFFCCIFFMFPVCLSPLSKLGLKDGMRLILSKPGFVDGSTTGPMWQRHDPAGTRSTTLIRTSENHSQWAGFMKKTLPHSLDL